MPSEETVVASPSSPMKARKRWIRLSVEGDMVGVAGVAWV